MQANSWHYKLFQFHLSFESKKLGKEGKKSQKSRERKELSRWNKKIFFIAFEGLSFVEKIKIW